VQQDAEIQYFGLIPAINTVAGNNKNKYKHEFLSRFSKSSFNVEFFMYLLILIPPLLEVHNITLFTG
jgi:hypothetical protein